jgi:aminomethyltransferase
MANKTPLYEAHVRLGAKIVDFAGWDMPLHYGSQLDEHNRVRNDAGMFDVSHMTVVDVGGSRARDFLRHLFANDVARLSPGKALYSCMLNEDGGVIDDLIVYYLADQRYRVIVNAATHDKDLAWIRRHAEPYGADIKERTDAALIAVQGPQARDKVHRVLDAAGRERAADLKPFHATELGTLFISRTGYTGEDGYEILVPKGEAEALWMALYDAGVPPIGLGARDTLRLEAGMALYGSDMDENTTPLESGLGWTVAWQPETREFIGRVALETRRDDPNLAKFVGLLLEERGVLRGHQRVYLEGHDVGEITSGSYSPALGHSIALARVAPQVHSECQVEMRGKRVSARVVIPPFVRHGRPCYKDVDSRT